MFQNVDDVDFECDFVLFSSCRMNCNDKKRRKVKSEKKRKQSTGAQYLMIYLAATFLCISHSIPNFYSFELNFPIVSDIWWDSSIIFILASSVNDFFINHFWCGGTFAVNVRLMTKATDSGRHASVCDDYGATA